ncbi:MAG: putative PEP-CTERM system TPR-repeat lipoprotein [Halieaceae bacterium]|jgi:putative PEP-CTERM system TPR-repeat lipoprotein
MTPPHIVACLVVVFAATSTFVVRAADSAGAHYEDARRFQIRGELPSAIIQLKNALQLDDQHLPSLLLMGELQLLLGAADVAAEAYSEALLLGASESFALPRLADAYLMAGANQRLLALEPESLRGSLRGELHGYRALAFLKLGERYRANAELAQALELAPLGRAPRIAQVEKLLSLGETGPAVQLAAELTAQFPDEDRIWMLYGSALTASESRDEALRAFTRALSINERLVSARLARAALYLDGADLQAAENDATYVSETFPGDPRGDYLLAQIRDNRGDDEGSRDAFARAAAIVAAMAVDRVAASRQLTVIGAVASARIGAVEQAIETLQAYQARHPSDPRTGALLASLLIDGGSATAALTLLQPLLMDSPESTVLRLLEARALSTEGFHEQAVAVMERIREAVDDPVPVSSLIAADLLRAGELNAGIEALEVIVAAHPQRMGDRFRLAEALVAVGRIDEATAIARRQVKEFPEDTSMRRLLARALFAAGDYAGARAALRPAIELAPDAIELQLLMARVAFAEGDTAEGSAALLRLETAHPDSAAVQLELSRSAYREKNFEAALRRAQNANTDAPGNLAVGRQLVKVLLSMQDYDGALEAAYTLSDRAGAGLGAKLLLADTLRIAGRPDDAVSQYKIASRMDGVDSETLFRIARQQSRLGAHEDASFALIRVIRLKPEERRYQQALVEVQLSLGQFDQALSGALRLYNEFPEDTIAASLVASAYARLGDLQQALSYSERASRSDPHSRAAMLDLYRALLKVAQSSEAGELLRVWLADHPDDPLVLFALSDWYTQRGDLLAALDTLSALVALEPKNTIALNNLAYLQISLEDPDALATARRAYAAAPDQPHVNDTLGWALVKSGEPAQAIPFLREAVVRLGDSAAPLYHLAVALHLVDRNKEARDQLLIALEHKSFEEEAAARALLDSLPVVTRP